MNFKARFGLAAAIAVGAVVCAAPAQAAEQRDCAALKGLALPDTRITAAERIEPGWKFPPSVFNLFAGPNPAIGTAVCRVTATIETEINIEVWLPDDWNGRFEGVGNGGFAGAFNYPALSAAVARGYAGASTDTGHVTPTNMFDADWADGYPQRVADFAHRAHHLMADRAKAIVAAYYAKPAYHSYFTGCSSGGWQGLSEAQRYPGDYDGIVAGAPAINFIRLQSFPTLQQQWTLREPASAVSNEQLKVIADAAVKYCDAKDGLVDGMIGDPRRCDFDPGTLACKPGKTGTCLTPPQVARVRASTGPQNSRGGMKLYPGLAWGTPPIEFPLVISGDPMMVRVLKHRPDWTLATFNPDRDIPPMEEEAGGLLDATNPDLGAFRARGGKLILYHGWSDPLLSPFNTIDYYDDVQAKMGATGDFARLFMVPGMAHCAGGTGPFRFDALSAVVDWVERGRAPERIVASHPTSFAPDAPVDRTRPLCVYPKVARYKGSGSIDDAANFACVDRAP